MANFVIIIDPDPERRSTYIQTIQPLLPPIEGLVNQHVICSNFAAIWAAHPAAPISQSADEKGAAIVWGDAIFAESCDRVTASQIRHLWQASSFQSCPAFDGYHALAVYHPDHGLQVGVDILGIFPLYYYDRGEVLLVGSSPELFRYHPCFQAVFNPVGLIGLLTFTFAVNNQMIWKGVRRLQHGHLLTWTPDWHITERLQYQIPDYGEDVPLAQRSLAEQVELLDQTLAQAIARHTDGQPHTLLLSGGLDSRTIAGYLHQQSCETVAVTFGLPSDLEMHCARSVAHHLGFPHYGTEIPMENYADYALRSVRWEHLASGLSYVDCWQFASVSPASPPRLVTGLMLDAALSGPYAAAFSLPNDAPFEQFFHQFAGRGDYWQQQQLAALISPQLHDDVADVFQQLNQRYAYYSASGLRRNYRFRLHYNNGLALGLMAWYACFHGWVVCPVLDRKILELAAALPMSSLHDRMLHKLTLCHKFPQLAMLPLDRNSFDTSPLQLPQQYPGQQLYYRIQQHWHRWQQRLGHERRFYHRIFDVNNPGWRSIRQLAELYRDRLASILQPKTLNALLPDPDTTIHFQQNANTEADKIKTLVGLMLWSANHDW